MSASDELMSHVIDRIKQNGSEELYRFEDVAPPNLVSGVDFVAAFRRALRLYDLQVKYRGGYANVGFTFDRSNRASSLRDIGAGRFALDTERSCQLGLREWFRAARYQVELEFQMRMPSCRK